MCVTFDVLGKMILQKFLSSRDGLEKVQKQGRDEERKKTTQHLQKYKADLG